jgi:signal transduction histidine kinase
LYLFAVIPWQYAYRDELAYGRSLNALYLTEKLVFLGGLAIIWWRARGGWKRVYAHWFGASLVYALSSYVANWAILRNVYYTGSLYDLPVAASMGWISVVGVIGQDLQPEQEPAHTAGRHGVWVARLGMLVILSLPAFAAWSLFDNNAPASVRNLRLVLTLVTMMIMGGVVFLRQHLLDHELMRLLRTSEESYENLKTLQTQLIQSEKLASLGQLVGGAAHELNNPLTAMLGYSELLAESGLSEEQRTLASKIALQVRRTRTLIASLLNFARQIPGDKVSVDANTMVQTAVKLLQPQFSSRNVNLQVNLTDALPQISGDPNQLLQVLLHISGNALQALEEVGGGILSIKTRKKENAVVLEFSDNGPGASDPERVFDPFYTTRTAGKGARLGLSACYGIIQEHQGRILCANRVEGGTTITIELPAVGTPPLTLIVDSNEKLSASALATSSLNLRSDQ